MSVFETILCCFLIPIVYILTYIAGKYDLVASICKMLAEVARKYEKPIKHADEVNQMTVKELKEKLNQFPDDLIVMIPNQDLYQDGKYVWSVPATNVARGVNEEDGCLFIDSYEEE